ncbi:MAG: hypothetical protein NWE99_10915 [Candidatus Bathyarchaeota archaeon]|nr:hypothetical protein [Candidatus Bathyarchaeota archaeon]
MTQVFQGETISKQYTFTDKNGALLDPDNIIIKIIDPSGVTAATPTLTRISEGVYELNYTLASDAAKGLWVIFLTATKGTNTEKMLEVFEVLLSR